MAEPKVEVAALPAKPAPEVAPAAPEAAAPTVATEPPPPAGSTEPAQPAVDTEPVPLGKRTEIERYADRVREVQERGRQLGIIDRGEEYVSGAQRAYEASLKLAQEHGQQADELKKRLDLMEANARHRPRGGKVKVESRQTQKEAISYALGEVRKAEKDKAEAWRMAYDHYARAVAATPNADPTHRLAAAVRIAGDDQKSSKDKGPIYDRWETGKRWAKETLLDAGADEQTANYGAPRIWDNFRSQGDWLPGGKTAWSLRQFAEDAVREHEKSVARRREVDAEQQKKEKAEKDRQAVESDRLSATPLLPLEDVKPTPTKVVHEVEDSILTDLGDAWWTDGKLLINTEGATRIGPIVKRMREGLERWKQAGKTPPAASTLLEDLRNRSTATVPTTFIGVDPDVTTKDYSDPTVWADAGGEAKLANARHVAVIQRGLSPDRWTTDRKSGAIIAWKGNALVALTMGIPRKGADYQPTVEELRRRAALPKPSEAPTPTEPAAEEGPKSGPTAMFGGIPINIPYPGVPPKLPTDRGPSPEIGDAIAAAKTLPKVGPTLWERIKEVGRQFKPGHPHPWLDRTKKLHAAVENLLNLGIGARRTGATLATEKILEHLAPLDHVEKAHFEEMLVLADLKAMLDGEQYEADALVPFTGMSAEESGPKIAERLTWLEGKASPAVKDAIEKRRAYVRDIAEQLVALKELPPEVLNNEAYYHHLVMSAWAEAKAEGHAGSGGAMTAELRAIRAGFQRKRNPNSLAYLTEYAQAEFDWLSAALSTIATRHVQDRVQALADRRKEMVKGMREANWVDAVGGQANANRIVELRQKIDAIHAENTDPDTGRMTLDRETKLELRGLHDELDKLDFTTGLMQRMAIAASTLTKAAQNDELPPDDGQWRVAKDELDAGGMDLGYVGWLAEQDGDFKAIRAAKSWYKAMAEKERAIEAHVALHEKKFRNWRSEKAVGAEAKRAGLVGWQPKEGNIWYRGSVVPDSELLDALSQSGLIPAEATPQMVMAEMAKIREGLLMGGRRQTWYVEPAIAKSLDDMKDVSPQGTTAKTYQMGIKGVRWMLLFGREFPLGPLTYLKNNLVGNLTKTLAAGMDAPKLYAEILPALTDLLRYRAKTATPELIAEIEDWIRNGLAIGGSGVSDVDEMRSVMRVVRRAHNAIMMDPSTPTLKRMSTLMLSIGRALAAMGPEVAGVTDEMFRLAAARARRKLGRGIWQSSARQVDAEQNPQRQAVIVANDLYGNYATTSRATSFASRWGLMGFPRWSETNLYGYMQGLRNAVRDARDAGRSGVDPRTLALAGTRLAINAAITYGALWAFSAVLNETMIRSLWDDDEDRKRMRRAIRWGSIIVGKTKDGDAKILSILGTWEDVLSWAGLQDLPDKVRAMAAGRMTGIELAKAMASAPFSKAYNMAMPP
ncbi:MAG: hypothetical protein MUP86_02185, partial [Dehalococcoidia bacterium]|nr:hypothetical protein [Dehalococcoidia bacterium]